MANLLDEAPRLRCFCGYSWKQRGKHKPKACPDCKSRDWDKPIPPQQARTMTAYRKLGVELRAMIEKKEE